MTTPLMIAWLIVLLAAIVWEVWAEYPHYAPGKYARWPANFGLFFLCVSISAAHSATLVLVAHLSSPVPGLMHLAQMPRAIDIALWLLIASLTGYWVHRLSHQLSLVWRFHRVHHCDTQIDPTTSVRHHPAELLLTLAIFQVQLLLFRPSAEAVLVAVIAGHCFAAATHTSRDWSPKLERLLGTVFITPAQHRVHHSDFGLETDSNYGEVFNVWDRLFGTFRQQPIKSGAAFQAGIAEIPAEKANDLLVMLALPALSRDPWGLHSNNAPNEPSSNADV